MTEAMFAGLGAFALSVALTLIAERVARRANFVARPVADRWHRQTVPLLGGVAIVVGTVAPTLIVAGAHRNILVLSVVAAVMGLVGLVDDVRRLPPQIKLLAQLVLASVLLYFGFALKITGYPLVDVFITLFWIIGITNAFNLLDNMDGLSSTIALVAAAFRLMFFVWESDTAGVVASASFLGAVAGFLLRNFPPATIFMGDAGSLFLGFFLAGLSLSSSTAAYSRGIVAVLVIPVLLLAIPIFDTAFVTVTRLLSGQRVDVGGRDHTSHRLVAIGLSERGTLLFLAGLSAAGGGVAALSYQVGLSYAVVLASLLVICLVLLGVHLSRVRVVPAAEKREAGTVLRLLADFQYKRQVLTLLLDACLIPLAYYSAYVIRFEDALPSEVSNFYVSLPVVLPIQLITLAAFGLYRPVWQYIGLADIVRIIKATAMGVAATLVALVYLQRFAGFSRTVFVLDWLLLVILVVASRGSFRFLAEMFRPGRDSHVRVLIYGAGHGGELIVREIINNASHQRIPVGFIDDDRSKHRTSIHGVPVLGGLDQLEALVHARGAGEVIVSSEKINDNGLAQAQEVCQKLDVPLRRLSVRLE